MAIKIIPFVLLIVFILLPYVLKNKKYNKYKLTFIFSTVMIGVVFSFGIAFTPKSSFKLADLFATNYIEEYSINRTTKMIVGSKDEKYYLVKIKRILGFVYFRSIQEPNEIYCFYKYTDYPNELPDFYRFQYYKIDDQYFVSSINSFNNSDEIIINGKEIERLNRTENNIYFILNELPYSLIINGEDMHVIFDYEIKK
jgi:hypothetical protein